MLTMLTILFKYINIWEVGQNTKDSCGWWWKVFSPRVFDSLTYVWPWIKLNFQSDWLTAIHPDTDVNWVSFTSIYPLRTLTRKMDRYCSQKGRLVLGLSLHLESNNIKELEVSKDDSCNLSVSGPEWTHSRNCCRLTSNMSILLLCERNCDIPGI